MNPHAQYAGKSLLACSLILLGFAATSFPALAQSVSKTAAEAATSINAGDKTLNYAVIAPAFLSANGVGSDSYIRLFNGKATASTFSVTLVGTPSGQTYGATISISMPSYASVQYSLRDFVTLTGAGSLGSGDTNFAVYLRNPDPEAGYQHVTYNAASALFENMSNCTSLVNEQMTNLHKQVVVTNVHTSQLANGGYPSVIYIHNYSNIPANYTVVVYDAGRYAAGTGPISDSGKLICQVSDQTVGANSTLSIPFSRIEANPSCVLDSGQLHANIAVQEKSGDIPNASVTHLITAKNYNGDINMSPVCAINRWTG